MIFTKSSKKKKKIQQNISFLGVSNLVKIKTTPTNKFSGNIYTLSWLKSKTQPQFHFLYYNEDIECIPQ